MEDIRSIVTKKITRHGLRSKIDESKCMAVVESLIKGMLPSELGGHIKVLYIKGEDVVMVSLSELALEAVNRLKPDILANIQSEIPNLSLNDIKILA